MKIIVVLVIILSTNIQVSNIESKNLMKIAIIPDTQFFDKSILENELQYVATQNFDLVISLGDIVQFYDNYNNEKNYLSWSDVNEAYSILENRKIPYVVNAGNHDMDEYNRENITIGNNLPVEYAPGYWQTFSKKRANNIDGFQGAYGQELDNSYYKYDKNGFKLLVISLSFMIRSDEILWAENITKSNLDYNIILVTHSFVNKHGEIITTNNFPSDKLEWKQACIDGMIGYQKLLKEHSNIIMSYSGHSFNSYHKKEKRADDSAYIIQMLNYQGLVDQSYIAILSLNSNSIEQTTYNPYIDDYGYVDSHQNSDLNINDEIWTEYFDLDSEVSKYNRIELQTLYVGKLNASPFIFTIVIILAIQFKMTRKYRTKWTY